ncbi:MAG: hypothetical protein GC190_12150 [Alphaproteobacteria bacterium]|nr:hypothetical protein [Alphaproteobacteria bacterium]
MNAEHLSLASVTPLRQMSRECAARIAGYTVMAWRYDRLPSVVDASLLRHYARSVVDGWLESGDLAATTDLWMDLKIYVAGDVALKALCASSPQPRFAGAGLLPYFDIEDDDVEAGETFNIRWHAADAEETLSQPVMRTALLQIFEALQRQPSLTAGEVKALLDWNVLCGRFERQDGCETLEAARVAAGEDWPVKHSGGIEHRSAAE